MEEKKTTKPRTQTQQSKKKRTTDMFYSGSLTMGDEYERAFDNLELRKAMSKQDIIEAASKKKLEAGVKAG